MEKTQRMLRVGIAGLAFACAVAVLPASASGYSPELRRYPYLTDAVGSSITVNWATDQSSTTALVRWGEVGDGSCLTNSTVAARQSITVGADSLYQWRARLPVSPDREYCYRIYLGSSPEVDLLGDDPSPTFLSQLPAGSQKPFSFIVFGDWGEVDASGQNPNMANVLQQIASSGARFAVTTGDNTHPGSSQTQYGDLVQTGADTSAVFGPSFWKVPGGSLPIFPALGNHGFATAGAYFTNWNQREAVSSSGGTYGFEPYCCINDITPGSYGSSWYAFDAGNSRFYVLEAAWSDLNVGTASDYQNDFDYHWTPTSPEYQWLLADLATHDAQHKFAFFHYPIYSDQSKQRSDPFLQSAPPPQPWSSLEGLLSAYGVDIAFSGHAHFYQRNLKPHSNSLVTYVTGGGGAHLATIGGAGCSSIDAYGVGWDVDTGEGRACGSAPVPTSEAEVFHFLKVSVNGTQVTVTPTDSLGRTFDVVTYTGPGPVADLSLSASSSPDRLLVGETITYTATVRNDGPASASDVRLIDTLPLGASYESATSSKGFCSQAAGTVTCNIENLARGESATVTIEARAQQEGTLANAIAVQGAQADPTANNAATQFTTVDPAADLSLGMSDSPDPVPLGERLAYTLTAANNGPSPATGVRLSDTLPPDVRFETATPSQGSCAETAGSVDCDLGTLESGATATIAIDVAPQSDGAITNTASVAANESDPRSADNQASEATTVVDATAPSVTIDSVSDYLVGSADTGTTLTWHASEGGTFSVRVGGSSCAAGTEVAGGSYTGAPTQATTTVGADKLASGANTIRVCVTDRAGNVGADTVRVSKDTTVLPPTASLTFAPEADARVEEANRSTNYGTSSTLRTDGGSDPDVESYLRFRVAGISGPIQSAKLRVYATTGTVNGPAAYTTGATWSESTISWSNRPARTSGATDDKGSIGTGVWVEYDVKPLVSGDGTYSFVLATTSNDGVDFYSREATTTTRRPQLVVTYQSDGGDSQPPSAPAALTAVAASSTRVDLSWTAAQDNIGVTGYKIYRDGVLLTTVGAVTSYADTSARQGSNYTYEVQAIDAAGNGSPLSAPATVTTPATATFAPEADARVEEANRSTNFGTSSTLRTDGGSDPDVESYLRFRVAGISGPIQSAKLRVYATTGTVNGPAAYTTGATWSESTISWSNRPARTSGATDDKGSIGTGVWVEYDVKPLVSGDGTYSFVLATTSNDGVDFYSREATTTTRRPQLVLTY